MTSFRTRIRRSALVLITSLLGLFGVLLYLGLSTILFRHVDTDLRARAQSEIHRVELATGHIQTSRDGRIHDDQEEDEEHGLIDHEEQEELREAIRSSVVLDAAGRVVWKGEAVVTRSPISHHVLAQVLQGETRFETLEVAGHPPLRRISVPVGPSEKARFILQTEKSLRFVYDTLNWLLMLLTGLAALIIVLAWFGSGWLAREALSPVEILSITAAQISGRTLGTRLSLKAPYEEFQRLAQAFNAMLDRLQKVFDAQRRFVADAAHELKTPLTAMKGNLEVVLQRSRSANEYREAIVSNLGEVERLTAMTKSLLTLAQYAGNRPPLDLKPIALELVVQEVVDEIAVLADEGGIHLKANLQTGSFVLGDASQLKQVVINLLDNAFRHTPTGGTVIVRLTSTNGKMTMAVEDTGPGIEPEHLPHLFERFYRIDRARNRNSGGTGLGLSIVKEIAEAHGGEVSVHSERGKGTTLTVSLPMLSESERLQG